MTVISDKNGVDVSEIEFAVIFRSLQIKKTSQDSLDAKGT